MNTIIQSNKLALYFFIFSSIAIIYQGWVGIVGTTLFSLFILDLFFKFTKNKYISSFLFIVILSAACFGVFKFGSYLFLHFDELFNIDPKSLQPIFSILKINSGSEFDVNVLLQTFLNYIKSNLGILFSFGANSLQVIIGIVFGFLFFFFNNQSFLGNSYWDEFILKTSNLYSSFFTSFQSVIKLQAAVSVMNTLSLSILSFVVSPIVSGELLPYWYILLPLTAILSLIPVIGNLFINLLIFLISLNVSVAFTFMAIIYFFLVHKIELVVIGKMIGKKADIPFLFVAISMLLGELFFHSMLGVLLGVVTLVFVKSNFSEIKGSNLEKNI